MKKKPKLIIIDGQNGAGKSTTARLLHARMKFTALIEWDVIKKLVSDFQPSTKYHLIASEVARAMTNAYLNSGVNVIYETFFGKGEYIDQLLKSVGNNKAHIFIYQIEASFDVRLKRIKERRLKRKRKGILNKSRLVRNDLMYSKNKHQNAKHIDSTMLTPNRVADYILKDIR